MPRPIEQLEWLFATSGYAYRRVNFNTGYFLSFSAPAAGAAFPNGQHVELKHIRKFFPLTLPWSDYHRIVNCTALQVHLLTDKLFGADGLQLSHAVYLYDSDPECRQSMKEIIRQRRREGGMAPADPPTPGG